MERLGMGTASPGLTAAASGTALSGSAVSSTLAHCFPYRSGGTVNSRSSSLALNRSRNESSRIRSPRGSGSVIASPLRNTVSDLAKPTAQSSSVISSPAGVNQAMSAGRSCPPRRPRTASWPRKNRRRRNTGWSARSRISVRTKSSRSWSPQ